MSLLQGFEGIRMVKVSPSLRERLERRLSVTHQKVVVARLRRFREEIEHDMQPEPWANLQAPMSTLLHDVCDALGLNEEERTAVLGTQGMASITEDLETRIHLVRHPSIPFNERQAKALAQAQRCGRIDLSTYRELCPHWSDETLRLDLADLVSRGLLVKNGAKKGTHYTLPR